MRSLRYHPDRKGGSTAAFQRIHQVHPNPNPGGTLTQGAGRAHAMHLTSTRRAHEACTPRTRRAHAVHANTQQTGTVCVHIMHTAHSAGFPEL